MQKAVLLSGYPRTLCPRVSKCKHRETMEQRERGAWAERGERRDTGGNACQWMKVKWERQDKLGVLPLI